MEIISVREYAYIFLQALSSFFNLKLTKLTFIWFKHQAFNRTCLVVDVQPVTKGYKCSLGHGVDK